MNKPKLVAIFAHPDDEAFGPAGSLAIYSKTHDVYVLCATRGQAGQNHYKESSEESLGDIREREVHESAHILGIKEVRFLGFEDGGLSNNLYHKLADKIMIHLQELQPEIIMTYEMHGVTGHIDHITLSMVTTYLFEKTDFTKELLYYCIGEEERNSLKDYFIYVPPGYNQSDIDKVIDISSVWELKSNALKKHVSQTQDVKRMLETLKKLPKEEYFLVRKK